MSFPVSFFDVFITIYFVFFDHCFECALPSARLGPFLLLFIFVFLDPLKFAICLIHFSIPRPAQSYTCFLFGPCPIFSSVLPTEDSEDSPRESSPLRPLAVLARFGLAPQGRSFASVCLTLNPMKPVQIWVFFITHVQSHVPRMYERFQSPSRWIWEWFPPPWRELERLRRFGFHRAEVRRAQRAMLAEFEEAGRPWVPKVKSPQRGGLQNSLNMETLVERFLLGLVS